MIQFSLKRAQIILTLAFSLSLTACASYQSKVDGFRQDLRSGQPAAAASKVKEQAFADGNDQVVYLFEYATAQQLAGNFEESDKAFLLAEDLTDVKDYHSISRVSGSLLLNAGMVQYKGDDYEKVLINAMLAVNFLVQNKLDEAAVECRKLNDKLYKYRFEGKRNYEQNPFAFYLSALIWEAQRNWDSAYIDYKKAYDLNPEMDYLREDLIRAGIAARRMEDVEKYRKQWPSVKPADLKTQGEAILIYQQGWGPVKRPNPAFVRVPALYPLRSQTVSARFEVDGGGPSAATQVAMNLTDVAVKSLDDQYGGMVAMRAAGIAAKAVVADQIRQKDELLGAIAWIGMNIADQADLRQWSSLPSSFQVAKLRLKPGKYRLRAIGLDASGAPTGEESEWFPVTIAARKKAFVNWRSVQ